MGQFVEEVQLWNTPTIGAFLLWRFTQGYCDNHPNGDAPIGLLHFIAIAILTNGKLITPISGRRHGLQSYVRSFEDSKDSDILLSIQKQALEKRAFTISSIDIAVAQGFLFWDTESGKLYPRDHKVRLPNKNTPNDVITKDSRKAEILGKWFSEHELSSIANYLKVVF